MLCRAHKELILKHAQQKEKKWHWGEISLYKQMRAGRWDSHVLVQLWIRWGGGDAISKGWGGQEFRVGRELLEQWTWV